MSNKKPKISIEKTGSLSKLGYSTKNTTLDARRTALKKAVKKYGYNYTMKKINALAILNKNKPVGPKFNSDKNWLKKTFGSPERRTTKKSTKRGSSTKRSSTKRKTVKRGSTKRRSTKKSPKKLLKRCKNGYRKNSNGRCTRKN